MQTQEITVVTGANGFVGKNLVSTLKNKLDFDRREMHAISYLKKTHKKSPNLF